MFNFRNEDENEDCIEIIVYGFKALTHKRFLETIEKKLLVKRKRKDYVHFELIVPTGRRSSITHYPLSIVNSRRYPILVSVQFYFSDSALGY
jgi:hypothetical protein